MSNIGTLLREEITRLSRKEVRSQNDPTKKANAQHRREIAGLKRQVTQLERQVNLLSRKVLGAAPSASTDLVAKPIRFVAKGLRSHRKRLGLSAADLGKLSGVSAQTIYSWESESSSPRREQLVKLGALRGIGKREATERLKQMVGTKGKSKA